MRPEAIQTKYDPWEHQYVPPDGQDDEPESPDSPIKDLVRRTAKQRPRECHVHTNTTTYFKHIVSPSSTKSKQSPYSTSSLDSTATSTFSSLLPFEDSMGDRWAEPVNDFHRTLMPHETKAKERRTIQWFRDTRYVNTLLPRVARSVPAGSTRKGSKDYMERPSPSSRQGSKQRGSISGSSVANLTDLKNSPMPQKKINPEEKERLLEVFKKYDKDKSGSIDLQELTDMCIELGAKVSPEQAKQLMVELDVDGSGTIDFDEFSLFWSEHPSLGKYRSAATTARRASGMQSLMGGLLQTLTPAITQNTLLKRLSTTTDMKPRRTSTAD